MPARPLRLFNTLTRDVANFEPRNPPHVGMYSCGPTVYNYPHIGNMRAYVFADTLGRTLSWKGYHARPRHQHHRRRPPDRRRRCGRGQAGGGRRREQRSDLGHRRALHRGRSGRRRRAQHPPARRWCKRDRSHRGDDRVRREVDRAEHCYELDAGSTSTSRPWPTTAGSPALDAMASARAAVESVEGKRHPADFAIWRTTPPGENRQMEWDSPWGRGAPGWHLECSVMSSEYLG